MSSTRKNSNRPRKKPPSRRPRGKKKPIRVDVRIDVKSCPLGPRRARRIAELVMEMEDRGGGVSIYLTGDAAIRKLNAKYLGRKRATDVLAFPLDDPSDLEPYLGEVVVSVETARKRCKSHSNGKKRGKKKTSRTAAKKMLESEIARYIIHGVLHLVDYNDSTKKNAALMQQREDELLRKLGFILVSGEEMC